MSTSIASSASAKSPAVLTKGGHNKREKRLVGYAWVSVAADVDFEGGDVRDSLAAVMRMAEAGWLSGGRNDGLLVGNAHVPVYHRFPSLEGYV